MWCGECVSVCYCKPLVVSNSSKIAQKHPFICGIECVYISDRNACNTITKIDPLFVYWLNEVT